MKKILFILLWFPFTICSIFFLLGYYATNDNLFPFQTKPKDTIGSINQVPYKLYTSLPEVLGTQTANAYEIKSEDINPQLIYQYLKKYKSPMADTTEDLIAAAQKYEIDPLFMVAIAQCESNLGKKMPISDEEDKSGCHNPFGWGIHKGGTLCFDTWQEGYQTVAEGLRKKYFDNGLTNPEDIMAIYTPPALEKGGSWAKCINQFLQALNKEKEKM
jgi:hypothetical protein